MGAVDDYVAAQAEPMRSCLRQLADLAAATIPDAEQVISYRLPAYRLRGGPVVCGFAVTARGASFYPFSGSVVEAFGHRLDDFVTTKGSIHFTADAPLPEPLVRDMLDYRLREIANRGR